MRSAAIVGVSDAACSSARHGLVLGSPLLVSGRLYDAERTQPIHHQLDSNCGKKDPEHDLGDDQADGVQALGQLVDVGKDQVIDRADQQDESQDQGGARKRDDLARRNDEDRDADRVQQIGHREGVDRDLLGSSRISTTSSTFLVGPAAMLMARIASTIAPPTATAPPLRWSRRRRSQPVANSTMAVTTAVTSASQQWPPPRIKELS